MPCNTDCWCGEKKVLAMNTQQEPTLKYSFVFFSLRCLCACFVGSLLWVFHSLSPQNSTCLLCPPPPFPRDVESYITVQFWLALFSPFRLGCLRFVATVQFSFFFFNAYIQTTLLKTRNGGTYNKERTDYAMDTN